MYIQKYMTKVDFALKPGRPIKGSKKRSHRIGPFRLSDQELAIWNDVVLMLKDGRNIHSQADAFVWCMERALTALDKVKMDKQNRKK